MRSRQLCIAALVLCAGSASAQSVWGNTAGGNWDDPANWVPAGVPLVAGDSATLPAFGSSYDVLCNASPFIDSLTLAGPNARLLIDANRTFWILTAAGVENNGEIVINPSMSALNTAMYFQSTTGVASLFGTGHVVLNAGTDPDDARIRVVAGTTLTLAQPVRGSGQILSEGLTDNQAAIEADVAGLALEISGTMTQTNTGSLQGTGGGTVLLRDATITGGQFLGGVECINLSTISNVILTGANGVRPNKTLNIDAPGIQNNGTLTVNTTAGVFNASLDSAAAVTITGNGTVDLNGQGDPGDAVLRSTAGNPLTVGANQTVSGNGRIDAILEPMVFRGIALADRAGEDLNMEGTFDFASMGRAQSAGGFVLLRNANVTAGSLEGDVDTSVTSTITDCQNIGTLRVRNNSTLFIENTLLNNNAIVVNHDASVFNAFLRASVDTAIAGTGTITLNAGSGDLGNAQLDVDDLVTLTVGANQIIEGTGRVDATGTIVMNGLYRANSAGFDLRMEGTHDLSGGGKAEGTGGGFAVFGNADVTGGEMLGDVHITNTTTMNGFTNSGSMAVRNNSTLIVDSDFTNNGTITINHDASVFDAKLTATQPITINGTGMIVLNGEGSSPGDAQLDANQTLGGSLDIPQTQTIIGRGEVDGPATIRGTVSGGLDDLAAGTIRFSTEVNLVPTSSIVLDFFDDAGTVTFDKIVGSSDLTLDGTIELRLQGGYEPAIGDTFTIIDAGTVTGVFATTNTPIIGTHLFRVIENAGDVTALWTCLGDVNLDGLLDASDFSAWIAAFNSGNVEVGDQNLDGTLSPADFSAWIANFNSGC